MTKIAIYNFFGKQLYVHEVLFESLVKLAQEKRLVRCTDCSDMTIAVDLDVNHQTNKMIQDQHYRY